MSLESQDCNNQEQHKSRQKQQDDYNMKAGRNELDSCFHREEREEQRISFLPPLPPRTRWDGPAHAPSVRGPEPPLSAHERAVTVCGGRYSPSTEPRSQSRFYRPRWEKHFPPRDNELGRPARKCHTSGMLTPNGKEYAQKIPREELTHVILKLLQAWKEPLSHFNQHIEHHQELPDDSLSKAKQISNMVHELKTGVEKVTEKMQSMGIISNSLNGMASSEGTGLSISNEANMMSDSDFIHCFRRDSNKVQSYLKILKCRIMPENSC
ncbi:prolactin-like [Geospiza fortis]|uniref:Prolactin-like n=1 Tax=Geospiza fortis TaxID=48883 RepID=A0A6I9ZAG5_GEOFO|nr:prolactin-like [Geospiza fortis]